MNIIVIVASIVGGIIMIAIIIVACILIGFCLYTCSANNKDEVDYHPEASVSPNKACALALVSNSEKINHNCIPTIRLRFFY